MYNYNLGLLFYSIAAENPDNPAIRFDESGIMSYGDLNSLSNQIARYFIEFNVRKGDVIGIFNNKTRESFALMLACLKIGAIYVNLDGSSPVERLNKIIRGCNPVLLTYDNHSISEKIHYFETPAVDISLPEFQDKVKSFRDSKVEISSSVCSDNPAYIMFTSGSTGFPKGAVMTHQNLLNFINWTKETYKIEKNDILSNVNPMYFDNSVFDFYGSLFNGASMAPVSNEIVNQAAELVSYIDRIKATIWFSVPSLLVFLLTMKSLHIGSFKTLRVITFGGEGFPKSKLKILFDLFSERIRMVNVYGPTECTCICSAYDIKADDFVDIINLAPLGFMAHNFEYLIIDDAGQESDSGELVLGGPQVGLGYFNDPERTGKSFIQHPHNKNYRKTLYKTGDLVRKDNDGIIHIIGRTDNQVKHMGYRIELEEIEAGFNSLNYINETGVVYQKFQDGLGQINAFITLKRNVPIEVIRADIKMILPSYMLPKKITVLDSMPKNQNGKIDRVALKTI